MSDPRPRPWLIVWFAVATLVSAFLVFQVQPVISKSVLPWFGGSPAVWTTCMLFFQVLLFAGYAYAHLITRWLTPRFQGIVHFSLLALALLVLPITPAATWKPTGSEHPASYILLILLVNVGLPYFILSATGPLIQAWFSLHHQGRSPYRLYALSNIGSLAALLTYPFLVEPMLTTWDQGRIWSVGFCAFAVICGYLAARLWYAQSADGVILAEESRPEPRPNSRSLSIWLLLPALASVMLLATTNHVCQDVAVIPFLWVAPLSLYLLTFIICFDREHWYSRNWTAGLAVASVIALCVLIRYLHAPKLLLEVGLYFTSMFLVCMVCHGELVRSKPSPRYLTMFYLMSSAGGALGGILVALVCPIVFSTNMELNLALIVAAAVSLVVFVGEARRTWLGTSTKRRQIAWLGSFAVLLFVGVSQYDQLNRDTIVTERNFYGVLHVERPSGARGNILVHGRTVHGFQFDHPKLKLRPTTYYSYGSGIGRTLHQQKTAAPLRIGAIGLGTGTVACYGQVGDLYRFYEINPAMVKIAREQYSFLSDSQAKVEVVLGDARLSLEREPNQDFDVLILDAFSSDSIPTHLLTREAFDVYNRHLKSDGVIAVHVSNRHLRLEPVVRKLAEHVGMDCIKINNPVDHVRVVLAAEWMLMTRDPEFPKHKVIHPVAIRDHESRDNEFPLWTDQYNNLFQIMKIY